MTDAERISLKEYIREFRTDINNRLGRIEDRLLELENPQETTSSPDWVKVVLGLLGVIGTLSVVIQQLASK